jgi:hypothetical protein
MRSLYRRSLWTRTESLKSLIKVVVVRNYLLAAGGFGIHEAMAPASDRHVAEVRALGAGAGGQRGAQAARRDA